MQTVIPVEDVSGGVSGTSWNQFYQTSTPAAPLDSWTASIQPKQDLTPVLLAVGGGVVLVLLLTSGRR